MKKFQLSYKWKPAGYLLLAIGLFLSVLYFWFDFRFKMPVFAVFSAFLEIKVFAVFKTNFADELIMLCFLSGLGLLVFSGEKNDSENLELLRMKAFYRSGMANLAFLMFSVLFVFGSGFMALLVLNMFSFLIFYLIFFYVLKRSSRQV